MLLSVNGDKHVVGIVLTSLYPGNGQSLGNMTSNLLAPRAGQGRRTLCHTFAPLIAIHFRRLCAWAVRVADYSHSAVCFDLTLSQGYILSLENDVIMM